jgi:type IV pilus assembly protein PilW
MTLVEMMVALTIGLAVMLAAARLLALANGAYAAQLEAARSTTPAATPSISSAARCARPRHADPLQLDLSAPVDVLPARLAGLDARSLGSARAASTIPLAAVANGSDVLAVRFPGAGGGAAWRRQRPQCAGFAVGPGEEGWSIFYVANNAMAKPSCAASTAVPPTGARTPWSRASTASRSCTASIPTTPRDGAANRYVNADAIRALDAAWPACRRRS